MTDLNPELIDKAARALWDEPGWEQATHEQRQHHREAAERALAAVAYDLRAEGAVEAFRDAAKVARDEASRCRTSQDASRLHAINQDFLNSAFMLDEARAAKLRGTDK